MGNEIAYHDISCAHQIHNFLKQGGAVSSQPPPGGQLPGPLRTPRSQSVLPTIQNWMTSMHKGEGGAEWRLRPLLPFFGDSRGNEPLGGIYNWSRWKHGISGGNCTNWEFITKLCEFYPRRKQVFLDFCAKTHKLPGALHPGPQPGTSPRPQQGP